MPLMTSTTMIELLTSKVAWFMFLITHSEIMFIAGQCTSIYKTFPVTKDTDLSSP
jgi:hypothetical protein